MLMTKDCTSTKIETFLKCNIVCTTNKWIEKNDCYLGWVSVGILNKIPFEPVLLLLLLELFPLTSPPPKDPKVGMFCFVGCCCSWASSPAEVLCCFVPLPVNITIFEDPEVADSPVDWRRGLVNCDRREVEAVVVVCLSGRRKVAERVTWGLLSDGCKEINTRHLKRSFQLSQLTGLCFSLSL